MSLPGWSYKVFLKGSLRKLLFCIPLTKPIKASSLAERK